MRGSQAFGRVSRLDVLRGLLVQLPLGFVYFGRKVVVVLLKPSHVLSQRCDLGY